jgi:hypothetical protein
MPRESHDFRTIQEIQRRTSLIQYRTESPASQHGYCPAKLIHGRQLEAAKRDNKNVSLLCVTVKRVDHRHRNSGKTHEQFLALRVWRIVADTPRRHSP